MSAAGEPTAHPAAGEQVAAFYGIWRLVPEESDYGAATPPHSAEYTLLAAPAGQTWFHARWTEASGRQRQIAYRVAVGGAAQPLPNGVLLTARFEDGALVSEAVLGDTLFETTTRRLVDADTLDIIQGGTGGHAIRARYRRTSAARWWVALEGAGPEVLLEAAARAGGRGWLVAPADPEDLHLRLTGAKAVWLRAGAPETVHRLPSTVALSSLAESARSAGIPLGGAGGAVLCLGPDTPERLEAAFAAACGDG